MSLVPVDPAGRSPHVLHLNIIHNPRHGEHVLWPHPDVSSEGSLLCFPEIVRILQIIKLYWRRQPRYANR